LDSRIKDMIITEEKFEYEEACKAIDKMSEDIKLDY
jgi:hypothetical protein